MEYYNVEEGSNSTSMCTPALILVSGGDDIKVTPLCDTGASSNYMSKAFYGKYRKHFKKSVIPVSRKVRLGDGTTTKDILCIVSFRMSFTNALGYDTKGGTSSKEYIVDIDANVFDNTSHDIIIGAQTLLSDLFPFFITMLTNSHQCMIQDDFETSLFNINYGDLVQPFPFKAGEAPEEIDNPLPGHGQDFLYAMEVDYEERKEKYFSLFDTHVAKDFAESMPQVFELLKTKGVKVFVANNWEGISGIEPVEYEFRNLPDYHFCKARNINPKLAENFYKELDRLRTYLFEPSESPIVSPIVVAYKATAPFIRVCGDFTWLNKHIVMPIIPIPHVLNSLAKIANFKYFIDVDVTNAFHQIRLGPITSRNLSIITPVGTFKPKFMLEGTSPATGILHTTMVNIFKVFEEWTIVLFDNILILANSHEDAYQKLEKFLDRCIEKNLFLKFEKSWLGVQEVSFFGYVCRHKEYQLSKERTQSILDIPFPTNIKQMQSFLGSCLFFKSFIPNYSHHASLLNDMVHKTFPWGDESKWEANYRQAFEDLKKVVAESFTLFYPDYQLKWILRVDASMLGIGWVLLQEKDEVLQPIIFGSSKFSAQAMNWSTIEQECYAIYYSVYQLAFYLRCKDFIIETDHRNLLWMQQSIVPKIIRWHIYLQSFNFLIRHIPGKFNIVADMLSRQWPMSPVKECYDTLSHIINEANGDGNGFESIMRQVHGRRTGHLGFRRTWNLLNKFKPRHGFSQRIVQDYIHDCPICQKDRVMRVAAIPPVVKTLHVEHAHSMVGCDTFQVTQSEQGMKYLVVMVNFFTRFVKLYAVADKEAITTANCIFDYISNFGLFDQLRMDPGSDFTSEVVKHLLEWLGPTRSFTLPDNPQADGVEGTNKQIRRHLLAICMDENCKHNWSSPSVLPIVQLILNEHVSSETGAIPFHAQFGDADAIYSQIPAGLPPTQATHNYVKLLAANLKMIREISAKYQDSIREKRTANPPPESANQYQPGDFVTYHLSKMKRMDKLTPRNQGPFEVIRHIPDSNWVEVRDLVYDNIKQFDLKDIQAFFGTKAEAQRMAEYDNDQFELDIILGHRGEPELRTTMEFYVRFKDKSTQWLTFVPDLTTTTLFGDYCHGIPQLRQLLVSAEAAKKMKSDAKRAVIDKKLVAPGTTVYVDIRSWGAGAWYSGLSDLPNKDTLTYVLLCEYKEYCSETHKKIQAHFPLIDATWHVDNWFVTTYGQCKHLKADHILLTSQMIKKYKLNLTQF